MLYESYVECTPGAWDHIFQHTKQDGSYIVFRGEMTLSDETLLQRPKKSKIDFLFNKEC